MIIPGASALGRGFDVFGRLSNQDGLLTPLMDVRSTDRREEIDGVEYEIPTYINVDRTPQASGTARFFSSRQKFESHFAAEVNVEASYGLFSAEFNAAYGSDRKIDQTHTFAMYDFWTRRYTLSLSDTSEDVIRERIKPEFDALPETFTPDNSSKFWNFFAKYGTHFTSQVELGGRLYYYSAIRKSYSEDSSTVSTKLSAEYAGLFGGSVSASSEWAVADQQWMQSRDVHIKVSGGESSVIAAVIPAHGVNKGPEFNSWLASIAKSPATMRFQLRPIWDLLSGARADALERAYSVFVAAKVVVHSEYNDSWTGLSSIFVLGRNIAPPQASEYNPAVHVVLLDPKTLQPVFNKRYYANIPERPGRMDKIEHRVRRFNQTYAAMYDELKPFESSSHIVILTTSNMIAWAAPTPDLFRFLQSCGAGGVLDSWRQMAAATTNPNGINYILVGTVGAGPGNGFEHVAFPYPVANVRPIQLATLLRPVRQGGDTSFKPAFADVQQLAASAF